MYFHGPKMCLVWYWHHWPEKWPEILKHNKFALPLSHSAQVKIVILLSAPLSKLPQTSDAAAKDSVRAGSATLEIPLSPACGSVCLAPWSHRTCSSQITVCSAEPLWGWAQLPGLYPHRNDSLRLQLGGGEQEESKKIQQSSPCWQGIKENKSR